MARKNYTRTKSKHVAAPAGEKADRAAFLNDLMGGDVKAKSVRKTTNGNGSYRGLEYDEP